MGGFGVDADTGLSGRCGWLGGVWVWLGFLGFGQSSLVGVVVFYGLAV